jgi:hypothetical protein
MATRVRVVVCLAVVSLVLPPSVMAAAAAGSGQSSPKPFLVPTERLISPSASNLLSISEGEQLWLGNDLADFLVRTVPNPFVGP